MVTGAAAAGESDPVSTFQTCHRACPSIVCLYHDAGGPLQHQASRGKTQSALERKSSRGLPQPARDPATLWPPTGTRTILSIGYVRRATQVVLRSALEPFLKLF